MLWLLAMTTPALQLVLPSAAPAMRLAATAPARLAQPQMMLREQVGADHPYRPRLSEAPPGDYYNGRRRYSMGDYYYSGRGSYDYGGVSRRRTEPSCLLRLGRSIQNTL